MKIRKQFSCLIVLLFCWGSFMTLHVSADDQLDHNGQLQLQVDRISQDEGTRSSVQDPNETELEKMLPDLFTEKTRAAVQSKQKEINTKMEKLQHTLFENQIKTDPAEKVKTALFTKDSDQYITVGDSNQDQKEKTNSQTVWGILFGGILAVCAGLFVLIRQLQQ